MTKIQLPIQEPIITTYQHHAFPLSIAANHPDFMNWFCSNYIQISLSKEDTLNPLNYYSFWDYFILCPIIERFYIEKELIPNKNQLVDFFTDAIDRNLYVITYIDEYYIPNTKPYMCWHFPHDVLLHGHDKSAKTFYTSGFNEKGVYSSNNIVTYDDFNKAIDIDEQMDDTKDFSAWNNKINLIRVRYDWEYKFHSSAMKESLNDYLLSTNSSNKFNMFRNTNDHIYGLAVYSSLDLFLEKVESLQNNIDIRLFHLIWEHKRNMNFRVEFLINNKNYDFDKILLDKLNKIENDALIIRNLVLKYNNTNNKSIITNIRERLKLLVYEEAEVYNGLLCFL
ncbi:hypothetical protein A3844_10490 [Paenibacillus helianthi]|uniref:Butirosin biosynthesis protein H N-terminal domain-containing protein n=1 Tax=Paenibacillus helianthi TaxID=1349432 RepID=A0ABX3ESB1_9BACL|nr:hypothetical protein [Paenibacillus helianthi]OKP87821.1 hypothetical protein A3844_10490 [Paenibacillus helianthi]